MALRASASASTRTFATTRSLALLLVLVALSSSFERVLAKSLRYDEGDQLVLFANKVGPFKNPR